MFIVIIIIIIIVSLVAYGRVYAVLCCVVPTVR
jgi:hypothetical protein